MSFDVNAYGEKVAAVLNLDQSGQRLMPLSADQAAPPVAREVLQQLLTPDLFHNSLAPDGAIAALWLYFSYLEECHEIVQRLSSPETDFLHAILHRQEPDSGNSAYWFRHVGQHPIFRELCHEADRILGNYPAAEFRTGGKWDPFSFILFCERARQQPNSPSERAALEIQRAEWQLLFDCCARPSRAARPS